MVYSSYIKSNSHNTGATTTFIIVQGSHCYQTFLTIVMINAMYPMHEGWSRVNTYTYNPWGMRTWSGFQVCDTSSFIQVRIPGKISRHALNILFVLFDWFLAVMSSWFFSLISSFTYFGMLFSIHTNFKMLQSVLCECIKESVLKYYSAISCVFDNQITYFCM